MKVSDISKKQNSVSNLKTTIPLAFKVVFQDRLYIAIAVALFSLFWIVFNVFDQLLFFSPVVTFYLPDDSVAGFILANITSVLMGILIPMNVYVIRNSKLRFDKSLFSGSILGIASSTCASCSSIGFIITSTLGGFGIVATDFLTNYQTPLRVVAIAILLWLYIPYITRLQRRAFLIDYQIVSHKINDDHRSKSNEENDLVVL